MLRMLTALTVVAVTSTAVLAQDEIDETRGFDQPTNAFGPEQGDFELLLAGSGSNDNDFESGGFNANIELGYFITNALEVSLRQQVSFADTGTDSATNAATTGAIDWHFPLGRFHPFIGANIGYVYGDGVNDTWAAGPEVGLKFYALEDTFIVGRMEYQFFFEDSDDIDDQFDDGRFVYTLGIGFNF